MDSLALKLSFALHRLAKSLRVPFPGPKSGVHEGCHMKPRVIGPVAPAGANRARQARQASDVAARPSFMLQCNDVIDAALDIIPVHRECPHRAMSQARSIRTSVARMRLFRARVVDRAAQKYSGAIGVPEAVFRMDLDPDGR